MVSVNMYILICCRYSVLKSLRNISVELRETENVEQLFHSVICDKPEPEPEPTRRFNPHYNCGGWRRLSNWWYTWRFAPEDGTMIWITEHGNTGTREVSCLTNHRCRTTVLQRVFQKVSPNFYLVCSCLITRMQNRIITWAWGQLIKLWICDELKISVNDCNKRNGTGFMKKLRGD